MAFLLIAAICVTKWPRKMKTSLVLKFRHQNVYKPNSDILVAKQRALNLRIVYKFGTVR